MGLAEKTKTAMDESRTLMLGAQILLGFQFQAPFQDAFRTLSDGEKSVEMLVLWLMIPVVGLVIAPSARHRIVERGQASERLNRFVTRMTVLTLVPFTLSLALDVGIAGARIGGPSTGVVAGLFTGCIAATVWLGPALLRASRKETHDMVDNPPTAQKIEYVLTESRIVLPGAQAMLGFQLAIVLTSGFAELAASAKVIHGVALLLIMVATILLMAPAAYHRIVYEGEPAPAFHAIASRFVLAATAFLAAGIAADTYVVALKIAGDPTEAIVSACGAALMLLGLWHIWPCLCRIRRNGGLRRPRRAG